MGSLVLHFLRDLIDLREWLNVILFQLDGQLYWTMLNEHGETVLCMKTDISLRRIRYDNSINVTCN